MGIFLGIVRREGGALGPMARWRNKLVRFNAMRSYDPLVRKDQTEMQVAIDATQLSCSYLKSAPARQVRCEPTYDDVNETQLAKAQFQIKRWHKHTTECSSEIAWSALMAHLKSLL